MIFYVRRPHIGAFHISKCAMYIVRVDLGCLFESRLTHASLPSPASSLGSPSPHKHTHTHSLTATPRHVNYEEVKRDLGKVAGVKHAHSLHIWSLTLTRTALAAHLALGEYRGVWVWADVRVCASGCVGCVGVHDQRVLGRRWETAKRKEQHGGQILQLKCTDILCLEFWALYIYVIVYQN